MRRGRRETHATLPTALSRERCCCHVCLAASSGQQPSAKAQLPAPVHSHPPYLEHQAEQDDHCQARHHVGVILDGELVAQHRRTLVLFAEPHGSSARFSPSSVKAADCQPTLGLSWRGWPQACRRFTAAFGRGGCYTVDGCAAPGPEA